MQRSDEKGGLWLVLALIAALVLLPNKESTPAVAVAKVTYVYEKDKGSVPPAVYSALEKLNARGISASAVDKDTASPQYATAVQAAAGNLPALVVESSSSVLRVLANPTTEEAVLESAS